MKTIILSLVITTCFLTSNVLAQEILIEDIALCTSVNEREPVYRFEPPALCSDSNTASIATIDSSIFRTIFLWTKVQTKHAGSIVHAWYKDGVEVMTAKSEYSFIDKILNIIDYIEVGLGWKQIANVKLKITPSPGYRTWSNKQLDPGSNGKWKVVVTSATHPDVKLCTVHFEVK